MKTTHCFRAWQAAQQSSISACIDVATTGPRSSTLTLMSQEAGEAELVGVADVAVTGSGSNELLGLHSGQVTLFGSRLFF